MSVSLAIVGDVHGVSTRLARTLDDPRLESRHVIFVGDLVDRGPDSRGVLEIVAQFKATHSAGVTVLLGNHDHALIQFLQSGISNTFIRNGGIKTVASYFSSPPMGVLAKFRSEFPATHRAVLDTASTFYEDANLLVSHMGFDPKQPENRSLRAMVLEPHLDLFGITVAGAPTLTVCGHYAQRGGKVLDSGSLLCIDTSCGTTSDGPLTTVLLPERTFIQT